MKNKFFAAVCAVLLVVLCTAALCACGYTYSKNRHALIYLPDELPSGVEKVEVQPKLPDDKVVARPDGTDYIERGVTYRVVVFLLQGYDLGTLGVEICGERYDWSLMQDNPYGKRYWVTELTVPKTGDITVEIFGEPQPMAA